MAFTPHTKICPTFSPLNVYVSFLGWVLMHPGHALTNMVSSHVWLACFTQLVQFAHILWQSNINYVSPPLGETYRFTLVCRQSASASTSASASVSPCGQDSRKTIRPRIIKPTHISHWGAAMTWLNFGGCDLIFKVTRGQRLWNLSLLSKLQEICAFQTCIL